jgi:threonine aldolase
MRQAGVLAAAGLVALEKSPADLPVDHENARFVAESLAAMPGIAIAPSTVQTNIVVFDVSGTGMTGKEISARLKERGVLSNAIAQSPGYGMRMVTHHDVTRAQCETAMSIMAEVVAGARVAVGD